MDKISFKLYINDLVKIQNLTKIKTKCKFILNSNGIPVTKNSGIWCQSCMIKWFFTLKLKETLKNKLHSALEHSLTLIFMCSKFSKVIFIMPKYDDGRLRTNLTCREMFTSLVEQWKDKKKIIFDIFPRIVSSRAFDWALFFWFLIFRRYRFKQNTKSGSYPPPDSTFVYLIQFHF